MSSQNSYLESFEKYKDIKVVPGVYKFRKITKSNTHIRYEVTLVDESNQTAVIKRVSTEADKLDSIHQTKTLHWVRKNLELDS